MDSKFLINLTPQQMSEVYAELGTTEEKINNDVGIILEWCQKQPHLPNLQMEQIKVRSFLVACKNSLEKTKEMLDKHYTIKTLIPKYAYFDTTSQLFNDTCEMNICIPLPKISNEGVRVVLIHLNTKDATSYNFMNMTKLMLMSLDIRYSKLDFAKKEIVILDMKSCTMNLVVSILEHLNDFVHSLIYFHTNVEELKKFIDPSILPINYGGTFPKTSKDLMDEWKNEMIKHHDWYLYQNKQVVDEKKRTNISNFQLESLDGSFRKLEVD